MMNKMLKKLIIKLYWKHCCGEDYKGLYEYYKSEHWHGAEVIRCINSYNNPTADEYSKRLDDLHKKVNTGKINLRQACELLKGGK